MTKINPRKLLVGDTIGVVAPSDPVLPDQEDKLQMGIDYLENLGFKVKLGAHIRAKTLGYAAAPQEKAHDINVMFADPNISAIICAQGGDTANAPLSLLDWASIQENPKIFLGLSDITVLLNAITHKTGLVTFHGNDILWGFGNELSDYEHSEFLRVLIEGEIGPIPPNQPRVRVRSGQATGRLLGGNLRCLLKLAGTPYWPDFSGAILFMEAFQISPSACHTAFLQMQHMGVFDQISGAVVGYIYSMQHDGSPRPHMEDILLDLTREFQFPILKMNDFGHNCPNTILPVGGQVFIDADQGTLEVLAPCLD
jgi:muramoyltetrapeptide carboxypeptidase